MCDCCTSIQVEITPSAAQSRTQTIPNPLVARRDTRQLVPKPTSRTFINPVSVLPVHLQRYIFEFIDKDFNTLFNFVRVFTKGKNIVFEFFDIEYIKRYVSPDRLRDFSYFNRRLLIQSQKQSAPNASSSSSSSFSETGPVLDSKNPLSTLRNTTSETTTILRYMVNETYLKTSSFLKVFYEFLSEYKFDNFPEEFLFRADTREPIDVFNIGFQRRGGNQYRPHVQYGGNMQTGVKTAVYDPQSGEAGTVVSTTSDLTYAEKSFSRHWVYVCSPRSGLDLSELDYQREVSLIYVAPEEIMLAYNKNTQQIYFNTKYMYFSQYTALVINSELGKTIITGKKLLDFLLENYKSTTQYNSAEKI